MSNKGFVFSALFLLLLAGGFLRVWNLGVPSFWVDEVNTVYSAQNYLEKGKMELPSGMKYERAKLHTYAVAAVYRYLGISEWTSRLPSVLFGIMSILIVYLLGYHMGGIHVGLMAAFLMAFSHFEVGWSRVTRMYPLLQLLTLLSSYAFIKGFEKPFGKERLSALSWISGLVWLIIFGILIIITAFMVHYLALFIPVAIAGYLFCGSLFILFKPSGYHRLLNKYNIGISVVLLGIMGIWFLYPELISKARFFLAYTPSWAEGPSTAQNKMYLFDFLISNARFPLATFFFVGAAQSIVRRQLKGWVYLWLFIAPLFLLSFVFTHRAPTYLFYVYPYFLILAAFGFVNIVQSEWDWLKTDFSIEREWVKKLLLFTFGVIFILAPWFRISLHIPFQGDGFTNLAVTHDEWKNAVKIVQDQKRAEEIIISSLPQVSLYYGLKADYCLNWADLAQSEEKMFYREGKLVDVYAGVPCVLNVAMLDSVVQTHPSGWILVTKYHFDHEVIIPKEISQYLAETFGPPIQTKNASVYVYHWSHRRRDE